MGKNTINPKNTKQISKRITGADQNPFGQLTPASVTESKLSSGVLNKLFLSTKTVVATYTVTLNDGAVFGDATGGVFTITLPPALNALNREFVIKKIDVSANTITVAGDGAEDIDGSNTQALAAQFDSIHVISNGTEWFII